MSRYTVTITDDCYKERLDDASSFFDLENEMPLYPELFLQYTEASNLTVFL